MNSYSMNEFLEDNFKEKEIIVIDPKRELMGNDDIRYPEVITDAIEKITELKAELEQTQDKIICGEISELAVVNFVLAELDQMKQELNQDLNNMIKEEMQHTKQTKKERGR